MSEQNKERSRAFTDYFSTADPALADAVLDREIVFHGPAGIGELVGLDAVKGMVAGFRGAFPDELSTVVDQIAEGDKVLTRWRARGTHRGDFNGLSPTEREFEIEGMTLERFAGGKIVEVWGVWDGLDLLRQLGAVPEPAGSP